MEAFNERSDRQLVDRVATGSVASFDVLYERHAPAVARYAWGLASSRETAQELVQDTSSRYGATRAQSKWLARPCCLGSW